MEDLAFAGQGRLLDFGSGAGALPRTLKQRYPKAEIYGCDISSSQLTLARRLGGGIHYDLCDGKLPYEDNFFDGLFVLDVLEHVPDPEGTMSEIARVLRPFGRLLLHCPCEAQPGVLNWFFQRLGVAEDLSRKVGGHIQKLTHRDVVSSARRHGLTCRHLRYCYHSFGQVFAMLTFWRRWCQRRSQSGQADWMARRVASLPWWRISPAMDCLAYLESRLFGQLPLGMGIDGCFEKQ